jgi:hypothetical protein
MMDKSWIGKYLEGRKDGMRKTTKASVSVVGVSAEKSTEDFQNSSLELWIFREIFDVKTVAKIK